MEPVVFDTTGCNRTNGICAGYYEPTVSEDKDSGTNSTKVLVGWPIVHLLITSLIVMLWTNIRAKYLFHQRRDCQQPHCSKGSDDFV
jgi:hypothetical protein